MSTSATQVKSMPVLVIEDEPAVMSYVKAVLERSGYAVVCSESGVDGVALLKSGEFLGVVSDMRGKKGVARGAAKGSLALYIETPHGAPG